MPSLFFLFRSQVDRLKKWACQLRLYHSEFKAELAINCFRVQNRKLFAAVLQFIMIKLGLAILLFRRNRVEFNRTNQARRK
jgi:hypothetical protein